MTLLYMVDVHQGDSGVLQLPEIGPVPRVGTDHVFGNFHTFVELFSDCNIVRHGPSYAMESARDSRAPPAVAAMGKSWSDFKSRGR